jgi:hypothetical protein
MGDEAADVVSVRNPIGMDRCRVQEQDPRATVESRDDVGGNVLHDRVRNGEDHEVGVRQRLLELRYRYADLAQQLTAAIAGLHVAQVVGAALAQRFANPTAHIAARAEDGDSSHAPTPISCTEAKSAPHEIDEVFGDVGLLEDRLAVHDDVGHVVSS